MIIGGFAAKDVAEQKSIDEQLDIKNKQDILTQQYQNQQSVSEAELAYEKEQIEQQKKEAEQQAGKIESEARFSYGQGMENTFSSQGQQEASFLKAKADSARGLSAQTAAAGLSGVKNSGTTALLQSEASADAADDLAASRASLDASRTASIKQTQFAYDDALTTAANIRANIKDGASYLAVYNAKQKANASLYNLQSSQLSDAYTRAGWNDTKAFASFLGGAAGGLSTGYSAFKLGTDAGWWK
jgi:hypothetical protein